MGGEPARRMRFLLPSPAEWFYLAFGITLIVRYAWIFDDSFIYFRYVDNLLFLDIGLTYNAGESVEGYTSPLLTLTLILLRSLHFSYPTIVLSLGITSFVAVWFLLVALNRERSPGITCKSALNFPLAYLAVNYSVASFFTSGNESALVHVVAAATALLVLRPESRILAVVVATAPLARPELAVSLGLTLLYVAWRTRRFPWWLFVASGSINGAWLLFRIGYYADLLPNTFYLKNSTTLLSGTSFEFGVRYLLDLTSSYHFGFVIVFFFAAGAFILNRSGRDGVASASALFLVERVAMLGIALSITVYVVRSGGSAMHYYYLAFPFVLATCAFGGVLEQLVETLRPNLHPGLRQVGMLALTLLFFSWYPPVLSQHPVTGQARMTQAPSPFVVTDPAFFRNRKSASLPPWPEIDDMREYGEVLARDGYDDVTSNIWCDNLYANYRVRSVHGLGLTDAILGRVEAPEFKRGHKPRLQELAKQMIVLQETAGPIRAGAYRRAVAEGRAPAWVVNNLETIGQIERRIFNRHHFFENLRIALSFPQKIQL